MSSPVRNFESGGKLYLEAIASHACDMRLHELFALLGGFSRVEAQEAIVARGLGFWACTAPRTKFIALYHVRNSTTYGFNPFGFSGFCFGSVGSNDLASGAGAGVEPPHQDESYEMRRLLKKRVRYQRDAHRSQHSLRRGIGEGGCRRR